MNRLILSEKHEPCIFKGVIGCGGYTSNSDSIFCLTVSGGENFLCDGITEKSILFVDRSLPYKENKLNVFRMDQGEFVLSANHPFIECYSGRVILAFNQYD